MEAHQNKQMYSIPALLKIATTIFPYPQHRKSMFVDLKDVFW